MVELIDSELMVLKFELSKTNIKNDICVNNDFFKTIVCLLLNKNIAVYFRPKRLLKR